MCAAKFIIPKIITPKAGAKNTEVRRHRSAPRLSNRLGKSGPVAGEIWTWKN